MTSKEKLDRLAANMWWSWNRDVLDIFEVLDPATFAASHANPTAVLRALPSEAPLPDGLVHRIDAAYEALEAYLARRSNFADAPRVAYFCMEYGLHESLPIYSGGLGILAGDHAKAASDLGIPFTAVGLFLREGYFEQHFTPDGWQQETFRTLDPTLHAVTLVRDSEERAVTVEVGLGDRVARVQAWRIELGRTSMLLLDTDFEENPPEIRAITRRLYQGGRETRIQQEIVLGIGGVRMLRALGIPADVYHLNEGHCAFLLLELLREHLDQGVPLERAEALVRDASVFTTHTPVMAGHDRFSPELLLHDLQEMRSALGFSEERLLSYGRVHPSDAHEAFTMTVLGLKLTRSANGVSRLNGEVARKQWADLYTERRVDDVPIGYITNGVHIPTWTTRTSRAFLRKHFGSWREHFLSDDIWGRVHELSDEELWNYRCALRRDLIEFVKDYVPRQSLPQEPRLDPDALTIGFARRFATYKRAPLLFHDFQRIVRIFARVDRPIQVIYSGKAHPADEGGKQFIRTIYEMTQMPELHGRLIFVENYNMRVGRLLTSGCDVWLNNPRRPMEASGTSGQKVGVHGGLNLSILDGWWPEGFNGRNGWAIGFDESIDHEDVHRQDERDARYLYDTLEFDVIPAFFERDERGIPIRWVHYMRVAMATLATKFSGHRMVADYLNLVYRRNGHE